MVYFIRRYQKGVKGSGTKDLLSSETEITVPMFLQLAEMTGSGKYVLVWAAGVPQPRCKNRCRNIGMGNIWMPLFPSLGPLDFARHPVGHW